MGARLGAHPSASLTGSERERDSASAARRRGDLWVALLPLPVALIALGAYLATVAPSISWDAGVSDSGELAAAAYTLGVPHPTGYPLYMLLGWAVSHLPLGQDPAGRLGVLSALCGALAAGGVCALVVALAARAGVTARRAVALGALPAGLGCAASPALWRQATAPETRTLALALTLAVLVLLHWQPDRTRSWQERDHEWSGGACTGPVMHGTTPAAAELDRRHDHTWSHPCHDHVWSGPCATIAQSRNPSRRRFTRRALVAAWALFGLALADHLLCLCALPALVLATVTERGGVRGTLAPIAAVVPGLCLYAYLPIRAAAGPALDWGDPRTLGRFLWVVSGAQYRPLMGGSAHELAGRLGDRLHALWASPGPALLLAGLVGLALLCRRCPAAGTALVLTGLTSVAQSTLYGAQAAPVYLLPCEALLCVGAGVLVAALWAAGRGTLPAPRMVGERGLPALWTVAARARVAALPLLATLVLVGATVAADAAPARALRDSASSSPALAFARRTLAELPPRALLFTTGDDEAFPLWYAQAALGPRRDSLVVDTPLLAWGWYRADLQRRNSWLRWGGAWQPDDRAGDAGDRAMTRAMALARAMAGRRPLYWTDPAGMPAGACGLAIAGDLFRCVPVGRGSGR